jgi:hypothetical protein
MKTNLKDKAIQIIKDNTGRWRALCAETGLDYNWLSKLSQGKIVDPGVNKIEIIIKWGEKQK